MGSFYDILLNGVDRTVDGLVDKEFGAETTNTPIDQIRPVIVDPVTPLPREMSQMVEGVDDKFIYLGGALVAVVILAKVL